MRTESLNSYPKLKSIPPLQPLPIQPKEVFCCRLPELMCQMAGSKSAPVRILFDTGSQRSYIRKSLQHRLGSNPIGKHLNTFGENKSKRENCDVFKINLANKSGGLSVEITAIGFPTICAPLLSSIDASEYPHLDGL